MKSSSRRYKVPFVNYPEHYRRIWAEVTSAMEECLARGDLILRRQLDEFEAKLSGFVRTRHAVGVNSGTDALLLSLKALGIGPGDEVITVAHTFVASIAAIRHLGAKPVLVDINEDDMNMDVDQVGERVTPKTRAVMPVHLNGRLCDMKHLSEIAEDNHLAIVEDAAQALGARLDGRKGGAFGDSGCFSFYPAKILGCAGDGGAVTTNDEELAGKIRLLRDHCVVRKTGEIVGYGYNSRLDNLQAAILSAKMEHLSEWIERRRDIAAVYGEGLQGLPVKLPPGPRENPYDVYQNYVVRVSRRDELAEHLAQSGIETLISWRKPLHRHSALLLGYDLPVTDRVSREVLSLPMYPEMEDEQIQTVIGAIRRFCRG